MPFGENVTDLTESVWPFNMFNLSPSDASQTRTDSSLMWVWGGFYRGKYLHTLLEGEKGFVGGLRFEAMFWEMEKSATKSIVREKVGF